MHILFFREFGKKHGIGMGHYYRTKVLGDILSARGHAVEYTENKERVDADVLVVDHMWSQKEMINKAKAAGTKVVLVDGKEEDVGLADLSVSGTVNFKSDYFGVEYLVIQPNDTHKYYNPQSTGPFVFVAMGGYDANNITEDVVQALDGIGVIIANNINGLHLENKYKNVRASSETDYYSAMQKCIIGITNGGLTLFQALHFGIPCVAVPQYAHQQRNINFVSHCCVPCSSGKDAREHVERLINNPGLRKDLSDAGKRCVDGLGAHRVCDLIEKV